MPLRFGSGQSNKVLEAAEAAAPIVGTPQAFRGLAALASHAGSNRQLTVLRARSRPSWPMMIFARDRLRGFAMWSLPSTRDR